MTNHTEVINYTIQKKNYRSYLEVGTQNNINFHAVSCGLKHGVDPDPNYSPTFKCTSDEFFEKNCMKYQCIFLDGLHTVEQIRKDFINAMECLTDDGVIIIHDTNPEKEIWTRHPRVSKQWTGDVFKFICQLSGEFITLPFDYGITIAKKMPFEISLNDISFEQLDSNRSFYLNIQDEKFFKEWL